MGPTAADKAESQQLVCVLDGPGEESVAVTFRVPAERTERGLRFTVPLVDATQNELRLQLADPNSSVETDPQAVLGEAADHGAGIRVPATTDFVIRPVHPGPVTVTVTAKGLPGDELTYSESHAVSQWEGKPGYRDVVDLVFSGPTPVLPLTVDVPEGATVREVKSTDLLTWGLSADGRQLLLTLGGEGPLWRTVSVVLDLAFNPDDPSISLGSMRVPASPMRAHARRLGGSLSLDLAGEEVEARGLARTAGASVPRYEFGADGFRARFRLVSPKVFLRAEMSLDAHLERGRVRCEETVNFTVAGGRAREFRLRLPEGVEVHPEGIPESDLWWVTDGPAPAEGLRPAGGVLVVRPAKKPDGTYSLNLQYEVPVSLGAGTRIPATVALPVFEPLADELRGQLRLFLEPGLTAQALESRGLTAKPVPTPDPAPDPAGLGRGLTRGGPSPYPDPAPLGRGLPLGPAGSEGRGVRAAAAEALPALVYGVTGTGATQRVRLLLEVRAPTPMAEVRTLTLVTFEGDLALMHARVVGSIARVPRERVHLELPAGFVVAEVTGSPLAAWEAVGDGTVLRLDLGERYTGDIRFEVQAEGARGRDQTDVVLGPLAVKEATRSTAYLAAVTDRDLTATAEEVTDLLAVPPGAVPGELGAVPARALCYRSLAGPSGSAREAPDPAPDPAGLGRGRGQGGELRLRVTPVEAVARARSTSVLHFTQGLLSVTCRVALTVSKGGLEALTVALPPGSADVAISGPSVKGYESAGGDTWRILFTGKVYDQTDLTVQSKSIITQTQQEVTYPGVDIVGIPQTGTVVVATDPDFQVEERGTDGLSPTMGKGAPGYGELVDGRALYGYSFERVPFKLSIVLPEIRTRH